MQKSVKYIPIIGWMIGSIAAGTFYLANAVLPLSLAIILSMIMSVVLTGAFHEDGFADFCDGFGSGYTKESIIKIMKDSRIGTFGVIGIFFILLTKFYTLQALPKHIIPVILILGHTVSRTAIVPIIYVYPYVGDINQSKSKPISNEISRNGLIFSILTGLLPFMLIQSFWYMLPLFIIVVIVFFVIQYIYKKIGGYTGDCLGVIQQIAEITFYLGVVGILCLINNGL